MGTFNGVFHQDDWERFEELFLEATLDNQQTDVGIRLVLAPWLRTSPSASALFDAMGQARDRYQHHMKRYLKLCEDDTLADDSDLMEASMRAEVASLVTNLMREKLAVLEIRVSC